MKLIALTAVAVILAAPAFALADRGCGGCTGSNLSGQIGNTLTRAQLPPSRAKQRYRDGGRATRMQSSAAMRSDGWDGTYSTQCSCYPNSD